MTINLVRWQFEGALVVASLAASGQTAAHAQTRPALHDTHQAVNSPYQPITGRERWKWFLQSTIGPQSLAGGVFSAGFGTASNSPKEYGPHWEGFGKRYGMRLTGVSTGNAMEASLGALWSEDPRYFLSPRRGFVTRVKYVIRTTFVAPHRDGTWHLAYARYIGNVGNNFLSNTWRGPSGNGVG